MTLPRLPRKKTKLKKVPRLLPAGPHTEPACHSYQKTPAVSMKIPRICDMEPMRKFDIRQNCPPGDKANFNKFEKFLEEEKMRPIEPRECEPCPGIPSAGKIPTHRMGDFPTPRLHPPTH